MSCTINNTINLNVQGSLPLLLRMVDPEEFSTYDSMTPTALDFLANYEDAIKINYYQIDLNANGGITRPIVLTPDAAEGYPIDGMDCKVPAHIATRRTKTTS